MTKEAHINALIAEGCDTNQISDGYHTFGELYEHRIILFIALCKRLNSLPGDYMSPLHSEIWKSKKHSDGSEWDGWFIMGIGLEKNHQITYHLPSSKWNDCVFAKELPNAPIFDGHTSVDVLARIAKL